MSEEENEICTCTGWTFVHNLCHVERSSEGKIVLLLSTMHRYTDSPTKQVKARLLYLVIHGVEK